MPVLLRIIINRCGVTGIELILKSTANIYSQICQIFDPKNQGFPILLLECDVNSESSKNIFYFSDDNPENNEGNNSNSNDNSENMEDSSNSEDNPNPENNEDSNSNSNRDSDMDMDDPEDKNVEEIKDPEYNAPERIVDDLDQVDKAKNHDPDALEYLREEYESFFEGVPLEVALKDIEEYLEKEFDPEYKRSEREADDLDAEEARSKRPRSESPEEEEENNKRQKSKNEDNDGEDGNDSGGSDGSAGGSGDGTGSGSSSNNSSTSNRVIRLSPLEEIEKEDEFYPEIEEDFYPSFDDDELWEVFRDTCKGQLMLPDPDLDPNMDLSLIEMILKVLSDFFL
jgi:hypothetical protein